MFYTTTTSTTTEYYYYNYCYYNYHYYSITTSVLLLLLLLLPLPLLLVQSDLFSVCILISQQCSQTLPVIPTNMNNFLHTLVVQFTVEKLFCKGSQDFHLKCSLNHIKFLLSKYIHLFHIHDGGLSDTVDSK